MSRQIQKTKSTSRPAPAPGTPGNPILTTPSGKKLPY